MTDFDSLREVWHRETGHAPARSWAEELHLVRARAERLRRVVRRRDWTETGVAILLFPLFASAAFIMPRALSAVGAAIVAVACVLVPIRLRAARHRAPDPAQPVTHALRAELAEVRAQERLLGSVAWWYVGPLALGVTLFVAGTPVSPPFKAGYAVLVLAAGAWVVHLNRRAVRRDLQPVARELESVLASVDEPSLDGASDDV